MAAARPGPVAITGSRSRARGVRLALHVAGGAASWAAFGAFWAWQVHLYVPRAWLAGVAAVVLALAAWSAVSVAWVAWSRSIYRRRHARTAPLVRRVAFERDSLGRRIVAPAGIAQARGQLLVSVDEPGTKRYAVAAGQPAAEPVSSPGRAA